MRRAASVWGVALAIAFAFTLAHATPDATATPLQVKKGAGAGSCPDATTLVDATNAAMKRTTLEARGADQAAASGVSIVVEFQHGDQGFSAAIHVLGGDRAGERALSDSGSKCDDLGQAVAITLAIMLDEGLPAPAPPPATSIPSGASAAPPPSASAKVVDHAPPPRESTPSRAIELAASVSAGAMFGVVRSAAPYLALEIDTLIARRVRVGGGGFRVFPQRFEEPAGGFVEVSLLAGHVFGCFVLTSSDRPVSPGSRRTSAMTPSVTIRAPGPS